MLLVEHLSKRFGDRLAVEDVSFSVTAGEVFGFLGPNGAGKTTTVRMLATLISPSSGSAIVAGIPLAAEHGLEIRQRIAVMPENPGLYLRLSVAENLEFFAGVYGISDVKQRILQALESVNLAGRANDLCGSLCGLDTRVSRIDPPASVRWFDIDFPEVIDLRRNLYADSGSYTMLATSLIEKQRLEQISKDLPAAIVAEGVFEYMEADDVKALLHRLTSHFAEGQVIFDCLSSFAVKAGRTELETKTGAVHRWAVDDIREVDALEPRLSRIDDLSLLRTRYRRELSWRYRLLFATASLVPRFRCTGSCATSSRNEARLSESPLSLPASISARRRPTFGSVHNADPGRIARAVLSLRVEPISGVSLSRGPVSTPTPLAFGYGGSTYIQIDRRVRGRTRPRPGCRPPLRARGVRGHVGRAPRGPA